MNHRIALVPVTMSSDRTTHAVLADGVRVGTAIELDHDRVAPWRLTLPGVCTNLRRSSREIVLATAQRLLDDRPAASVVYVPTSPHAVVPLVISSREV
jgi:hypothetical protein